MEYVKSFCFTISGTYVTIFSEHDAVGDKKSLLETYVSATKLMLIFSNLMCIGMMVFGGAFISIWIGPTYGEIGQPIIVIFAIIQMVMSPGLISLSMLQGLSKHKLYSYLALGVSLLNLILSILLVQTYGLIGVAIGAAIPQVIFYVFFVPRHTAKVIGCSLAQYLKDTYLKLVIPSVALFACLYFFLKTAYPTDYLLLLSEATASTLVYGFLVYALVLNKNEKDRAKTIIGKVLPI